MFISKYDRGGLRVLRRWLDSIPDEIKKDRPRLDIAHALVQVYTGDLDAGEGALSLSCQAADRLEPEESARIEAYILAIGAYALWIRGSGEQAGELSVQTLGLIPEEEGSLRAFTYMVLGPSQSQCDNFEPASQALKQSVDLAHSAGNDRIYILVAAFGDNSSTTFLHESAQYPFPKTVPYRAFAGGS